MSSRLVRTAPFFWPAVISLLLTGIFLSPLHTVDLWWQLDSGRWMLEHGQYLGHEVRSFSMPGAAWPNFSWLFQVVIAAVEWVGGYWGLLLLKAIACWLILFLLLRSATVKNAPAALLLAPLLFASQLFPAIQLRPHLFEGVFLATTIWLFHRQRSAYDPLWYTLLTIIWANCHASAVVGAAALAVHYLWGADFRPPPPRKLLHRLPVAVLLCSLVFATPNGFSLIKVLLNHSSGEYLHIYIREWFSPEAMPLLLSIALPTVAIGALLRRHLLTPAELLLITLFLIIGTGSRRFLYELALLLIRPASVLLGELLSHLTGRHRSGQAYWQWLYGMLLIGLLVPGTGLPAAWNKLHITDYPIMQRQFPRLAMAVLQPVLAGETQLRVWNDYGWGGYLEWQSQGRLQIYIDGRTPTVFTEEMMLTEKLARTRPQMLRSQLKSWKADAVVLRRDLFLPIPPADAEWTLVGFDSTSVVYLRAALAQRYAVTGIGFDPFRTWPRVDALHAEQEIRNLHHLLKLDGDNGLAWLRLGQLLGYAWAGSDTTEHTQALEAIQHAIALNPEDGFARLGLAWLRGLAGNTKQQVAQPVLDMLNTSGSNEFKGFETQTAALLLETGYPQQALQVLSPEDWLYHQQLDTNFNVWLLRQSAHTALEEKDKAAFDRRMAEQLALDAGPRALERLHTLAAPP